MCYFSKHFYISLLAVSFGLILFSCGKSNGVEDNSPHAKFTYTSTRTFPVVVQFVNTSVLSGPGPGSYLWDFGDGGTVAMGAGSVSHLYTTAGVYTIKLVQSDAAGTKDSVTMNINLGASGPSGTSSRFSAASFTFSITNNSFTTTFTNTSVNAGSYLWEFGDGTSTTSASGSSVIKTYPAPGTYHVVLTATSSVGMDSCSATINF